MGGKELSSAEKTSHQNEKTPLASLYGAIQGLSELSPEVIKVNIQKNLMFYFIKNSLDASFTFCL